MSPVLEIGSGESPDPRADITSDIYELEGVDEVFDIRERWPFDDAELRGVIARHVIEHVTHGELRALVFPEAARVLEPGGWFEITVPVGDDEIADSTHQSRWTWGTLEDYCDRENDHWQRDTGFILEERDADVWFFPPLSPLTPALKLLARRWPAECVRRCSAGEITARYRRVAP